MTVAVFESYGYTLGVFNVLPKTGCVVGTTLTRIKQLKVSEINLNLKTNFLNLQKMI